MEITILYKTDKMKKPIPYIPKEIRTSGNVGIYSVIVSSGEGIKPVTTIPIPFSIQIETNTAMQAKVNVLSFSLVLGMDTWTRWNVFVSCADHEAQNNAGL